MGTTKRTGLQWPDASNERSEIKDDAVLIDGRGGFIVVEHDVLTMGLKPQELAVYIAILSHADAKTHQAWPTKARLSAVSGVGVTMVKRCLKTLQDKKLISIKTEQNENGSYKSNVYTVRAASRKGGGSPRALPRSQHDLGVGHHVTGGGSPRAPKQDSYSTDANASGADAPAAPKPRKTASQKKPAATAPPDPLAAQIVAILTAYRDATGTLDPSLFSNKTNRADAKALVEAGFTPEQVRDYCAHLTADAWWNGKAPSLKHVVTNIAAWLKTRTAQQASPSGLHIFRMVTS